MNLRELQEAYRAGRGTMTVVELAPVLGLPISTVHRLCVAGQIPGCLRLGRRRLISVPAVLRWLEALPDDDHEARA